MITVRNIGRIRYTVVHRRAFRQVEKKLLGHNTMRGFFHDMDKVILYFLFDYETARDIHRYHSRHHEEKARTDMDFIQMAIDWECARITKPDKPLDAWDTLHAYYPALEGRMAPILKGLGLRECT